MPQKQKNLIPNLFLNTFLLIVESVLEENGWLLHTESRAIRCVIAEYANVHYTLINKVIRQWER